MKALAVLLAFSSFALAHGPALTALRNAPEAFYAETAEELEKKLDGVFGIGKATVAASASSDERLSDCVVECRLFGLITIKSVPAKVGKRPRLVPGGQAVGISIYTEGVLVVGLSSFSDSSGRKVSPASDAGLKAGDVILKVDGTSVSTSKELEAALSKGGGTAKLTVERNGKLSELTIRCGVTPEGETRIGAWVRDSTIGIGTLSFYDEATGVLAALGHAVTDADTGALLRVKDGKLVLASLLGVTKGRQGAPGELHGTFDQDSPLIGEILSNTELGIFGRAAENVGTLIRGAALPVAFPDEVREGEAIILTSAGGEITAYSCRIIKTGRQDSPAQKGLVIEISDERLIDYTGGIVQGMSGSPIIQDGKLVGAVTHVFVNDPQKGYGAYAYWMYSISGG